MAGTWNEPGEHSVNLTHLQRCVNFFGAALQYHHRSHISYLLGIMFHHLYYVFCKKIVDRVCDAVLVCFSAHLRTELTYDNDIHIFILLYPPLVFARLFVDRFTLCWRWFASQFNIWCSLVYTYMLEQEMEQAKAIPSAASARHTTIFRPGALCITNSSCANHICITFHASSMLHIPFRITIHYTKAMNRREYMAVNKDEIMIWLFFLFVWQRWPTSSPPRGRPAPPKRVFCNAKWLSHSMWKEIDVASRSHYRPGFPCYPVSPPIPPPPPPRPCARTDFYPFSAHSSFYFAILHLNNSQQWVKRRKKTVILFRISRSWKSNFYLCDARQTHFLGHLIVVGLVVLLLPVIVVVALATAAKHITVLLVYCISFLNKN